MFERKFLKIAYSVVASLVAFAVVINVVSVPVSAAEVESLPAYDIGITSSYDDDYVYVNDNGSTYSIPRNTVASGVVGNSYPWSMPNTLEVCGLGYSCPVSYWYSPEHKCIVVISSSRTVSNEDTTKVGALSYSYKVGAFSSGSFWMVAQKTGSVSKSGSLGYMVIYDCVNNTVIRSKSLFDSKSTSIKHYYCDAIDNNGVVYDDLVCVFSSYEIEGFYGGNDDVITPDYYFDYQYLFYTEQKGYVFVDSSKPLDYISNSNDPTKAVLYFDDNCNKHVYTSELGNSWISDNSISSIYGNRYTMDYSYFYDSVGGQSCYTMVYCNDEGYEEEPLYTPEFGDISDVLGKYQEDVIVDRTSWYKDLGLYTLPSNWTTIDWDTFLSFVGNKDIGGLYNYVDDLSEGKEVQALIEILKNEALYTNMTDYYMTYYRFNSDGTYSVVEKTSIYGYVVSMYELLFNMNMRIDSYFIDLHNDLKSVFDNISNTNSYLYDIKGLIQDMPDYSKQFDKLTSIGSAGNDLNSTSNAILNEINNNILALNNGSSSGTGSGEASPDIGGGSSSNNDTDILNSIYVSIDKMSDYFVPDISEGAVLLIDDEIDEVGFQEFIKTLDDDILAKLDKMSDDEEEEEVKELFEVLVDENALDELFNENFIQSAVSSIATGTLVSGQFANITTSGASGAVPWINANVTAVYNAVGFKMQSVVLLGAAMFVVNIVVRKGV